MSARKVFPISQGVACQLKWTWNTLRLAEASSACCHRVDPIPLTAENFQNIHNHPTWVEHRKMQLQGIWPQQGCQYCEQVERTGGTSQRLLHLREENIYPPELDVDPVAVEVTPRILEIFINNSCNLACIYCDESNSSRIQNENKKFGYQVPGVPGSQQKNFIKLRPQPKSDNYGELLERFFLYLDAKYLTLRKLIILGGEPFYQKEFLRLLDFIEHRSNPELTVTVVSNLMVPRYLLENFVERSKRLLTKRKIKRIDLTASIDCLGIEQEYVRHGIELDQWIPNFEYMLSHRWLYVSINNTITALTLRTLPDLLIYINEHRKYRNIHHAFGAVQECEFLHPKIFGKGFFDDAFRSVIDLMPEDALHSSDYMQGLRSLCDSHPIDREQQQQLGLYLDEIDRRRGTSWKSTFPWLHQHLM